MGLREEIQAVMRAEVPADSSRDARAARGGRKDLAGAAREARERRMFEIKAQALARQFREHPGRNAEGLLSLSSRRGETIQIRRVEATEIDGTACVEVWLTATDNEDPDYRLINPPILVEDPAGPVRIRDHRFREDPLAAMVEVLTSTHGGRVR